MALTKEEAAQLEALQKKAEEPDEEPNGAGGISRVLNVTVDLGDDAQVERAIKLGLMSAPAADEDEGEEEEGEEESPRRRGYFGDDK